MKFSWRRVVAGALASSALVCAAAGAPEQPRARRRGRGASAVALYRQHCAICHGEDGRAQTFGGKLTRARDLTVVPWQDSVTDRQLFNSITHGVRRMPAFKKKLNGRQVESLVTYVRGLKE